jgi:hypothetical protein
MLVRHNGIHIELIGMALHDHIGWVFSGAEQFAAEATGVPQTWGLPGCTESNDYFADPGFSCL